MRMRKDVQEVADILVNHLGFRYAGTTGTEHHLLIHPNGGRTTLPATPHGGNRWRENAIAEAERVSGRRVPRPKSGRGRGARIARMSMYMTDEESRMSSVGERLAGEWGSLAAQWDAATTSGRPDLARQVLRDLARVESSLRRAFKPCPSGNWRIPDTYFDEADQ